jgi:hypothetical protein
VEDLLPTQWTVTLVNNQREYKLPPNHFKPASVEYVRTASTDIVRINYIDNYEYWETLLGDEGATGEPRYYYLWRKLGDDPTTTQPGSILLHPTPGTAENGKTLRLWGYKHPDAVSASDLTKVLEIEAPYVEAAVLYASHLAKRDDGDITEAEALMAMYERVITKVKQARARQDLSTTSRMLPRGWKSSRSEDDDPRYWLPWG